MPQKHRRLSRRIMGIMFSGLKVYACIVFGGLAACFIHMMIVNNRDARVLMRHSAANRLFNAIAANINSGTIFWKNRPQAMGLPLKEAFTMRLYGYEKEHLERLPFTCLSYDEHTLIVYQGTGEEAAKVIQYYRQGTLAYYDPTNGIKSPGTNYLVIDNKSIRQE